MLLSQEQISRYLRHIIMPEISGPGQKKILEATVEVLAESADTAAPLAYYLAAVGVGRLICIFENNQDQESLFNNLRDLNGDISITTEKIPPGPGCTIIFGSPEYAARNLAPEAEKGSTVILALNRGWKGYIQTLQPDTAMAGSLAELLQPGLEYHDDDRMGCVFSTCLLGALAAIETVKLLIGTGTPRYNPSSFDLLNMLFENLEENNPLASSQFFQTQYGGGFNSSQAEHYIEGVPRSLAGHKALIVGTGGLGSPAAYALVKAGIGTVGLVDYDTVDISNLNRQILHSTSRLGLPKVDSAEIFLRQLNPGVNIIKHNFAFNTDNAIDIIGEYDVIIDAVDNFQARYLLNDACFLTRKPMIEAGVAGFDGLGMTIIPGSSMCYRCVFPHVPAAGTVPSCSETGVLGPVPGVMGFIEACEAAKLLTRQGKLLTDNLLSFDALELSFEVMLIGKNKKCPLCGDNPTITGLQNYKPDCDI